MPDVPVLVISGDLDGNTPTSGGRKVARQFAHPTLAEIPNVGRVQRDLRTDVLSRARRGGPRRRRELKIG